MLPNLAFKNQSPKAFDLFCQMLPNLAFKNQSHKAFDLFCQIPGGIWPSK